MLLRCPVDEREGARQQAIKIMSLSNAQIRLCYAIAVCGKLSKNEEESVVAFELDSHSRSSMMQDVWPRRPSSADKLKKVQKACMNLSCLVSGCRDIQFFALFLP